MVTGRDGTRWLVGLSVPRRGGWRTWLPVSGDFEQALAEQENSVVIAPHADSEVRRGRDFVRVVIVATTNVACSP
jgi:hypothetical protein